MQKNVVFWWDELLQVCGWHSTTFRVGKRSPVQGETVRSVKNMEERLRSEKWKRYEEFLVEGEKSPATVRKYIHDHKPEFISEVLRPCRVLSENL